MDTSLPIPGAASPAAEAAIVVAGLNHWFGEGEARKQALFGIDLSITRGQVIEPLGEAERREEMGAGGPPGPHGGRAMHLQPHAHILHGGKAVVQVMRLEDEAEPAPAGDECRFAGVPQFLAEHAGAALLHPA